MRISTESKCVGFISPGACERARCRRQPHRRMETRPLTQPRRAPPKRQRGWRPWARPLRTGSPAWRRWRRKGSPQGTQRWLQRGLLAWQRQHRKGSLLATQVPQLQARRVGSIRTGYGLRGFRWLLLQRSHEAEARRPAASAKQILIRSSLSVRPHLKLSALRVWSRRG